MFPERQCPLCNRTASLTLFNSIDARIGCSRCGTFKVTRLLYDTTLKPEALNTETKELLPYLSAHTRQAAERGEEIFLENSTWKDFALAHKDTPVPRKMSNLLELIARRTKPGNPTDIIDADAPLLDAVDNAELGFLLRTQHELGCIERLTDVSNPNAVSLKAKGWEQVQAASITGIPGKCFIAMAFHESLNDAYERGIFLAVKEDCKMDPIRLDRVQHNEKICDKIVAEIRTCQFLIADVTRASANVYFEAGFAMALGRTVIWTCRDADFDKDVRFDTRQYPYIRWKTPADLREQLADRIKATIPGAT